MQAVDANASPRPGRARPECKPSELTNTGAHLGITRDPRWKSCLFLFRVESKRASGKQEEAAFSTRRKLRTPSTGNAFSLAARTLPCPKVLAALGQRPTHRQAYGQSTS